MFCYYESKNEHVACSKGIRFVSIPGEGAVRELRRKLSTLWG